MSTAAEADPSHPISFSGESSPSSPTSSGDSSPSSSSTAGVGGGGSGDPTPVDQVASRSNASVAGDGAAVPTSPRIGMGFETEEDAYEFYKAYAAQLGFVVRKSNKSKNSRHTVTRRLFVCSKQGFRQEPKKHQPKKHQDETAAASPASSVPGLAHGMPGVPHHQAPPFGQRLPRH
ncbi:hypothetical protein GUJ93_ZPchr0293g2871 [Zizania palustris]|uniref:FAR1 domain-containing protein n=1 Tax=Zizania palustris TaxID=103762 RepID=A0A8J5X3L5_ZIZPA|nr:hypothetical protein GUJ93_ZPchr0293g2871 [Zizania palustris]